MVREEGASSLLRGAGPNVFRAILMNASQLASYGIPFTLIHVHLTLHIFQLRLFQSRAFEDEIL